MKLLIFLGIIFFITHIIEKKISLRASLMFTAVFWISAAYLVAFALKDSIKQGDIGLMEYKDLYRLTYLFAFIGCGYLLPVMMGDGKRKKPLEKEND